MVPGEDSVEWVQDTGSLHTALTPKLGAPGTSLELELGHWEPQPELEACLLAPNLCHERRGILGPALYRWGSPGREILSPPSPVRFWP